MPSDLESIAQRLKQLRKHFGKSQKEMVETLGISLPAIQAYECGRNYPGGNVFMAIAMLGGNANWILTGSGEMLIADEEAKQIDEALSNSEKCCATCRYWSAEYLGIEENSDLGECLRFPPSTNGTRREPPSARAENTVFPVTAMVRWCGEWATAEAVLEERSQVG